MEKQAKEIKLTILNLGSLTDRQTEKRCKEWQRGKTTQFSKLKNLLTGVELENRLHPSIITLGPCSFP